MENDIDKRPETSEGTPTTRVSPQDVPPYVSSALPREEVVRSRRPHHVPVLGPLLLILAGSVFLLNNLGLLSWNVWGEVWRLWPLIPIDRKSTRLNSSHGYISYAVFCLKKK